MSWFGDLEAAIMDVMWAADSPLRVREFARELNAGRPLAFNTVQTVMENLFPRPSLGPAGQCTWTDMTEESLLGFS